MTVSDYVVFLDADDWADPDMCEKMMRRIHETDADVVIAGMRVDRCDDKERLIGSVERRLPKALIEANRPIPASLVDENLINLIGYAWNKMYRTELLHSKKLRFVEGISQVEDVLFNADVLTRANRVALLNGAYVHYVQRPRVTLGTRHYGDYIDLRLRAVQALDRSLAALGAEPSTRLEVLARSSQSALVNVVRSAARQKGSLADRKKYLQRALSVSGTAGVWRHASSRPPSRRRDAILLALLRREHLRTAIFFMWCAVALQQLRQRRPAPPD